MGKKRLLNLVICFLVISGLIFLLIWLQKYFDIAGLLNTVSAQDGSGPVTTATDAGDDTMVAMSKFLNTVLNALYFLSWPMLTIAGKSMDNSLVYGEVFGLDVPLWRIWNMMKNFANYILGFMLIVSIFIYFFKQGDSNYSPKKIIPKLLLGGVLIQASWFLMGLLIDLSTILVYGLGGLPLNIMEGIDHGDEPYMKTFYLFKGSDTSSQMTNEFGAVTFYGYGPHIFIPCKQDKKGGVFITDKQQREAWIRSYRGMIGDMENKIGTIDDTHCVWNRDLMVYSSSSPAAGNIKSWKQEGKDYLKRIAEHPDTPKTGLKSAPTLKDVVDKAKGFTGPLYAIYHSLINLGAISMSAETKTGGAMAMEFLIKAVVAIALLIPLFALAVIMIIRLVLLWIFIAFSPIIVLTNVFGFKQDKLEKASIGNILSLIFLPVVAVFALAISLIFLTALNTYHPGNKKFNIENSFNIVCDYDAEGNYVCQFKDTGQVIKVEQAKKDYGISIFTDIIGWLIMNLIAIGLMWAIVFSALKTSKITSGIVDKIEGFSKSMMKAVPIIPGFKGGPVSVGALGEGMRHAQAIPDRLQSKQFSESIEPFIKQNTRFLDKNYRESVEEVETNLQESSQGSGDMSKFNAAFTKSNNISESAFEEREGVSDSLKTNFGANSFDEWIGLGGDSAKTIKWLNDRNVSLSKWADELENYSGPAGKQKQKEYKARMVEGMTKMHDANISILNKGNQKFYVIGDHVYRVDIDKKEILEEYYIGKIQEEGKKEDLRRFILDIKNIEGINKQKIDEIFAKITDTTINFQQKDGSSTAFVADDVKLFGKDKQKIEIDVEAGEVIIVNKDKASADE